MTQHTPQPTQANNNRSSNSQSHRWAGAVLLLCLLVSTVAWAARQVRLKQTKAPVTTKAITPKPTTHRPYTESWSMWAQNDRGWLVYATLFIARMHPFVGTRVGVQLTLISPKGKVTHRLAEYKKKALYVRKPGLNIRVGKHRLTGSTKKGKMVIDLKDVACWLTFQQSLSPFRLYGGTLRVGRRRFQGIPFSPRATIKGKLRWKNKVFAFKGTGYLDRSWQHSPHKIARSWFNARAFGKQHTILLTSMVPARGWSARPIATIAVAKGGKWLFRRNSKQLKMRINERQRDRSSKYSVPQRLIVESRGDDSLQLKLKLQQDQLLHKLDVLAHVPKMLRFFVQKLISKPYLFRSRATIKMKFQYKGKQHKITSPALTEAVFLNP